MSLWQRLKAQLIPGWKKTETYPVGITPGEKDTITAIRELSRAVMDNPDTVEIYLALGNLYRSRGDVERAVQIRESLLIRPELSSNLRSKVYFELGQDYRRAGLMDRAFSAYMEAERLGISSKLINAELAAIYSSTGDWEKACEYFYAIGNSVAEAHFMVRQGTELIRTDRRDVKTSMRLFSRAVKIYPASIEAWSAMITQYTLLGKWGAAAKALSRALDSVAHDKSFMLFEEILNIRPLRDENETPGAYLRICDAFNVKMTEFFISVLAKRPPEIFSNYYGALLLQRANRLDESEQWLDKTLVMQPGFWYGRLAHLDITRGRQSLSPLLDADIDFFVSQSGNVKRFVCSACGLNREQLFYCCQRCGSWHSAAYKFTLNE